MILGVAQLVFNTPSLDACAERLHRAGYTTTFRDDALASHPSKEPFLGAPRAELAMAHFAPPAPGQAVEVTEYAGAPPAGRASYAVDAAGEGPTADVLAAASHPITRVAVATTDPGASRGFWTEALGFRDADESPRLLFPALLEAWRVEISLAPAGNHDRSLDADGLVLLTLLCSNLDRDLAALAEHGGLRFASPWDERVGGRQVRIALVEGPGGELVELLQAPSREHPG